MSDSSSLSSAPSSDDEKLKAPKTLTLKKGKLAAGRPRKNKFTAPVSPERSPSPPARETSPPHEYILADNPDIAVLVTFRARFHEAFPKHVPHIGPQDIEAGIVGDEPSELVEIFLCALLALVLNRKKVIERGHHSRAMEEAIQTQKGQWPSEWNNVNPLHGNQSFTTMNPTERLVLLKTLVLWSLNTSEVIGGVIRDSYKQSRREDDLNQPLSVQPWGSDGRKRRYWLIEGQNDTPFRLYIENQPKLIKRTWWSVAGTLDELKEVGQGLTSEGGQADRRLADKITASMPRLEQSEEKRKRREYKKSRRAAFTRPEPGFSLYEGRTRGKRMRYTFSDDEDDESDAKSGQRSTRQSNRSTPAESAGPTVTASGRQVRSRFGRTYGEPIDTATNTPTEGVSGYGSESSNRLRGGTTGKSGSRRSDRTKNTDQPRPTRRKGEYDSIDDLDEEDEAASTGNEWDGDDDDLEGKLDDDDNDDDEDTDEDEIMASAEESDDPLGITHPQSLIVQLKYRKGENQSPNQDGSVKGTSNQDESNNEPLVKPNITSSVSSFPPRTSLEQRLPLPPLEGTPQPKRELLSPRLAGFPLPTPHSSFESPSTKSNSKSDDLDAKSGSELPMSPSLSQQANGVHLSAHHEVLQNHAQPHQLPSTVSLVNGHS